MWDLSTHYVYVIKYFPKRFVVLVKEEDLKYFVNVTEKFKSTLIHGLLDKSKNYTCR